MKEHDNDTLAKAIAELKEQGRSTMPPQDVVNETLKCMAEAESGMWPVQGPQRTRSLWSAARWAVAAAVLLTAGYVIGRVTGHTEPDIDQLRAALLPDLTAALEPQIRQSILDETTRTTQRAMVAGYVRMKDELTEQYRTDLNRFAVQTFTASNTVTNELLEQLVEAVPVSDHDWPVDMLITDKEVLRFNRR